MKKRQSRWNKKADTVVLETTIFIVLNIVFIALLLIFVYTSKEGAFIYEQIYAKQIALLIDNAKPDMTIGLNMENAIKIAKKNNQDLDKIVSISNNENKVIISLSSRGGHSFQYFSDYNVSIQINQNHLTIKIKEKNENVG